MTLCYIIFTGCYNIDVSVTTVIIKIRKFLWVLAAEDDSVGVATGITSVLSGWHVTEVLLELVPSVSVWLGDCVGDCRFGVSSVTVCSGDGNSPINFY